MQIFVAVVGELKSGVIYLIEMKQYEEVDQQVKKLLDEDIIEHLISPYNSPLLVVHKKSDGDKKKWRLVVDFIQLNKKKQVKKQQSVEPDYEYPFPSYVS